jgi:hypothetical protein
LALIKRHPGIPDYILEMSLTEIAERGGIADLFEQGHLIIIRDYRLDFDFAALADLSKSTESVQDPELRRKIKKLTAPSFFEGVSPRRIGGRSHFEEPLRQAIYDTLCRGDRALFDRAARALRNSHDEALRIFRLCFPNYEPFRFVPSVRLTQTMFENLHWDNHSIDADFHQARVFANLDTRPRIWNVSSRFIDWVRDHYEEHRLARFAGRDPNLMLDYIAGSVLGGTANTWMDHEPRHRIAFDPGEVWMGESRLISHQILYGEAALVYMWFVKVATMTSPDRRFNKQVERLHEEMALKGTAVA